MRRRHSSHGDNKKTISKKQKYYLIAVAVLLVCLVGFVVWRNSDANSSQNDSSLEVSNNSEAEDTSSTTDSDDSASSDTDNTDSDDDSSSSAEESEVEDVTGQKSTLDLSTIDSIDIEPMSISVSYVKGVGGFEFEVHRTPSGTQYVDFKNSDLVGTKCTDDEGVFATILENPESTEQSTLSKTIEIDDETYGLSLASVGCTNDSTKLLQYQQSFSDAFSLLKKI